MGFGEAMPEEVWPTLHRETGTNTSAGNSVRVSDCERCCQHYSHAIFSFKVAEASRLALAEAMW